MIPRAAAAWWLAAILLYAWPAVAQKPPATQGDATTTAGTEAGEKAKTPVVKPGEMKVEDVAKTLNETVTAQQRLLNDLDKLNQRSRGYEDQLGRAHWEFTAGVGFAGVGTWLRRPQAVLETSGMSAEALAAARRPGPVKGAIGRGGQIIGFGLVILGGLESWSASRGLSDVEKARRLMMTQFGDNAWMLQDELGANMARLKAAEQFGSRPIGGPQFMRRPTTAPQTQTAPRRGGQK